ncbi:MAG TPA: aldose epimerase family protein [Pirellulales bacterium]|jgi:aldose 1-epimerase|nr:aldose epimerase family protein [Pirellulales bacterium]
MCSLQIIRSRLDRLSLGGGLVILMAMFGPALAAEDPQVGRPTSMEQQETKFGRMPDGAEARLFTCSAGGMRLAVTDYGARIVSLEVPDRQGRPANVALGFDSLDKCRAHTAYFGCTTGRYANRIARGKFTLKGHTYQLATNNDANHLHGGTVGFDRHLWQAEPFRTEQAVGVQFKLRSPDGDEGYPGNLDVSVTYTLTADRELRIDYVASTDKTTVLNLTNHGYWNLAGSGDVLNHVLTIAANRYVEVDQQAIPTGRLPEVAGTPLDFNHPTAIGARMAKMKAGVPPPGGYDHCYVIDGAPGTLRLAARVVDPASGRTMEVLTTEPGVQLYTSNYLNGDAVNGGYQQHAALCLETQHFPDSPNHPSFPSTVLEPGQTYRQTTVHRFSNQ